MQIMILILFLFCIIGVAISHKLPMKQSGFPTVKNGIIQRVAVGKLSQGVQCVHRGHQGLTNNVKLLTGFCKKCTVTGPPMQSTQNAWCIQVLSPIYTPNPTLLIILASRSSNGRSIPSDLFPKLKETISLEYP
jgi:hypothetical protein